MKRFLPFISLVTLTACDKSYVLKISKDEVSMGALPNPTIKSYDFKAPDDEAAYSRSAQHFFRDQMVDSVMNFATGKTTSFDVFDKDGQELKIKLSLRTTDSIDKIYRGLLSNAAKHLKNPLVR